jgi:hypothetical protein
VLLGKKLYQCYGDSTLGFDDSSVDLGSCHGKAPHISKSSSKRSAKRTREELFPKILALLR